MERLRIVSRGVTADGCRLLIVRKTVGKAVGKILRPLRANHIGRQTHGKSIAKIEQGLSVAAHKFTPPIQREIGVVAYAVF